MLKLNKVMVNQANAHVAESEVPNQPQVLVQPKEMAQLKAVAQPQEVHRHHHHQAVRHRHHHHQTVKHRLHHHHLVMLRRHHRHLVKLRHHHHKQPIQPKPIPQQSFKYV